MSDKNPDYVEMLEEFYPRLSDKDPEVRIVSTLATPERVEDLRKRMEDGQIHAYLEWSSETLCGSVVHPPQGNRDWEDAVPVIPGKVWLMPAGSLPSDAIRQQADFLGFPTYALSDLTYEEMTNMLVPKSDIPTTDE